MKHAGRFAEYRKIAQRCRRLIVALIHKTKSPHIGSSFSIVEILVALYFKLLDVDPKNPDRAGRDRIILSKGHACPSLYVVLYKRGFMTKKDLMGFAVDDGILEQHPRHDPRRGVEVSTGSLGHGLGIGAGMALAGKIGRQRYRVCVILSDGELNEGSTWEAVMFAGHHKLNNLVAFVDHNKMQALGHTQDIIDLAPIGKKWAQFGWRAQEIDGHDFGQIFKAYRSLAKDKPNVVILNTVKGKGVSFMENQLLWHYRTPNPDEYERSLKELVE